MTDAPLQVLLFPALLLIGLIAPGWLLGRVLATPAGAVGSFIGSAALLMNFVLLLDALGIALTPAAVALAIASACVLLIGISRVLRRDAAVMSSPATPASHLRPNALWLAAPLIGVGAIVLRAAFDPLSGYDTLFRWDFLARQMLSERSLSFYPPVSSADFLKYGWCDGIAPLVSTLYFLAYCWLGSVARLASVPIVIGEAVLLFYAVYSLVRMREGPAAGMASAALLATSSVLLWGVAMGQETGLTALGLVAMFLFIAKHADAPRQSWLVWAGIAAGFGALAREYGLCFVAFGAVALAIQRTDRRGWLQFGFSAALTAAPWYLRNAIKTGNPLFSHSLGGLLPSNPVHVEYMDIVARLRGIGTEAAPAGMVFLLAISLAAVPWVMALAGVIRDRKPLPYAIAAAGCIGLWIWSVGPTAGGAIYSLRVLTPAIALAAVIGGPVLARVATGWRGVVAAAVVGLLAVDAGGRSLFMPIDPGVGWWRVRSTAWLDRRAIVDWWNGHSSWTALVEAANGRKIVVADTYAHALLAVRGGKPVPLFSPEIRFLFSPIALAPAIDRLRAQGVRFILLSLHNPFEEVLWRRHEFFRRLSELEPTTLFATCRVYDLEILNSKTAATAAREGDRRP